MFGIDSGACHDDCVMIEMVNASDEGPQRLQLHADIEDGLVVVEVVDSDTGLALLEMTSNDLEAVADLLSRLKDRVFLASERARFRTTMG